MERFKACEKEMKTKAYSKEGLTNSMKLDPREKEKVETSNFVSSMLEELERQVEALEAEQETIQATMKKGRKDTAKQERISDIEEALERHKWHLGKLEIILRMLENGNISPDSVNNIQDDIRYYVESNQDVDFAEDEEIYDELNLDYEEEGDGESFIRDDTPSYSLEDLASENSGSVKEQSIPPFHIGTNTLNSSVHKSDLASSASAGSHSSNSSRKGSIAATTLSPVISHSHLHSSIVPTSTLTSSSISGMKPAPPPIRSTNELKYASAAAAGSSPTIPQGLSPLPPPSGGLSLTGQPSGTTTSSAPGTLSQSQDFSSFSPLSPTNTASTALFANSPQVESSSLKTTASDKALPKPEAISERSEQVDSSAELANSGSTASMPPVDSSSKSKKGNTTALPPGLQDLISSFDAARRRIGTPPPIASIAKLLESSYLNCPDSFIANKPKYYQPETPFPTPSYYPQEPLTTLNDSLIFPKMDIDTLFYIFYYRQGTYQQSLAAKELKNRSWRFHKRFLTWFQRHEEPKVINNDFEQGTYRYFDFEGLWLQRRKSNFKFEYQFLEDEL